MVVDAEAVIAALHLKPHPEGGHYAETYRHRPEDEGRGACTVIYYLLKASERSHWHRIDAVEVWHHYAGGPLRLKIAPDGQPMATITLGPDLQSGHRRHAVVPPGAWQAAEPVDGWSLLGCTVSPAFEFAGFELAPPEWEPDQV